MLGNKLYRAYYDAMQKHGIAIAYWEHLSRYDQQSWHAAAEVLAEPLRACIDLIKNLPALDGFYGLAVLENAKELVRPK